MYAMQCEASLGAIKVLSSLARPRLLPLDGTVLLQRPTLYRIWHVSRKEKAKRKADFHESETTNNRTKGQEISKGHSIMVIGSYSTQYMSKVENILQGRLDLISYLQGVVNIWTFGFFVFIFSAKHCWVRSTN